MDPRHAVILAEKGMANIAADPLKAFRFSSQAQRNFATALNRFREVYLRSGSRAGKAQPVDEPVLTPGGWRTIGGLRVGDAVFDGNGSVTSIDGVFPQGRIPVYRLTFSDGSWTRCSGDHLWAIRDRSHRFRGKPGHDVLPLSEIIRRWGMTPKSAQAFALPGQPTVYYPESDQPIKPYLMGVLLGDGHLPKSSVSFSTADKLVLERVGAECPAGVSPRHRMAYDYRLTTGARGGDPETRPVNGVLQAVRELGLEGSLAHEKFIPDCYLRASREQRLALLHGLMDTDGWCDKRKGTAYFTTTSPRLRDGLIELVRSLGGFASCGKERRPSYVHLGQRRTGRPSWSIRVSVPGESAFWLDRKASINRPSQRRTERVIRTIAEDGVEECVCISLSGANKTYLTRGMLVTHNTTIGARCGVALARGLSTLDGVGLPLLGTPNVGVVLAKGRAMAEESVIKAYRQSVGTWPHHLEKNGNAIAALWVKPDGSRSQDWRDWSCIRFFVEGGQSVAGMRLDWAHADEPPDWDMWVELRMRGRANRHFIRFITATPIDKREWLPLRNDFRGCEWPKGKEGKVEIRMSVYDNKALGKADIEAMERESKGPLQKAKLLGEYVDLTGTNPFDAEGLKRWGERCYDGKIIEGISPGGIPYKYEVWEGPEVGNGYLVVADPSAGIEDEAHEHDPAGIVVVSRQKPYSVVARYNGYMASRDLGWLSAKLASEYNRALLVWERNSGYGESFFHGLGGYGNVYVEHHHDARGLPLSQRIGWLTTATTRGTIIGALQKAILQDGLALYSRDAVDSLGSVVLKRDGLRPEAGAGSHDEDMIILGLAAHLLETMPYYAPPQRGSDNLLRELGLRRQVHVDDRDPFAFG